MKILLKKNVILRYVILFICVSSFFFQISSSQSNLITYYFGFKPASFFNNFDKPTFFPPSHIIYLNIYAWWVDAFNWKYDVSCYICRQY